MSRLALPYNGESVPQGHQARLSDHQLSLIDKLLEACKKYEKDQSINSKVTSTSFNREKPLRKERLQNSSSNRKRTSSTNSMKAFRSNLPSFKKRNEILELVRDNQVVIIAGETGCGKTTQVPQYILEQYLESAEGAEGGVRIVCTQPRRVAAISVAERVAQEKGECVGNAVGYMVRHDSRPPSPGSSILYCTTGVLVQRLQSDPDLSHFTHIIIDEIHERDVLADILLVIMKTILTKRTDLKLILMSATLDAQKFSRYMFNCPVLQIPGFMFPVAVHHLEDVYEMTNYALLSYHDDPNHNQQQPALSNKDIETLASAKELSELTLSNLQDPTHELLNLDLIAALVKHIHDNKPVGAILVFVPGWEEIQSVSNMLQGVTNATILTLHGSMSAQDQKKIFAPIPIGHRKIIIGTNIAESSVTINDIAYVVDCGMAKMMKFDSVQNISSLEVDWISKANARQRMGRAGRLRKGEVFKLYTKARESQFTEFMVPEITRCRLEQVILKLKVLGYDDVYEFFNGLMDKPADNSISVAHQTLIDIGAVRKEDGHLTGLGHSLGMLSSDPRLGKMMILGVAFSCLDPILSVVVCLEYKSPFVITGKMLELKEAVDRMAGGSMSDHLAIANIMAAWDGLNSRGGQSKVYGAHEFSSENMLSQGVMWTLDKMKKQLSMELHKAGLTASINSKDAVHNHFSGCEAVVRSVIAQGLLPNIVVLSSDTDHSPAEGQGDNVSFHPRSCNRSVTKYVNSQQFSSTVPRMFTFYEKISSSSVFISDSTAVGYLCILFLASHLTFEPIEDEGLLRRVEGEVLSFAVTIWTGEKRSKVLSLTQTQKDNIEYIRKVLAVVLDERVIALRKSNNCNAIHTNAFKTLLLCLIQDKR